jgi:REP element-mobilizing transposase RayT
MPHSFASLLIHAVFSTKSRQPALSPDLSNRLFPYIGGIIRELRGTPLAVNGPVDHVHLLFSIPANVSVSETLRVVKANSSRWVHDQFPLQSGFAWQSGYGAFTVSKSNLEDVRNYISAQQEHHRSVSFQAEFLALLNRHGIQFDTRDLWG